VIKNLDRSLLVFVLICLLVTLLGAWLMAKTTHWGPWAFSDSATYVSAARKFLTRVGICDRQFPTAAKRISLNFRLSIPFSSVFSLGTAVIPIAACAGSI
jgi:hypothetical protein